MKTFAFTSIGLFYFVVILLSFAVGGAGLALAIYGVYLAFSASILLGVLSLLIEPSPFIYGAVMFFAHVNLPQQIAEWIARQ